MAEFHPSILVSSSLAGAETCQLDTVVTLGGNPYWQWLACDAYYINLPTKPSMTSVGVSIIDKTQQNNVGCQTKGWLHRCRGCQGPGIKRSSGENTREEEISTGKHSGFSIQAVTFFARTRCTLWNASPKWSSKSNDCSGTNCCSARPLAPSECHCGPCKGNSGQWWFKT